MERIPAYDLYGDPLRDPAPGFLHAESIRARAPLHGWTIASHRHPDLSQLFLFTEGGGTIGLEAREITFAAPWLIWIPAGLVHGFSFRPGTDGFVLTIAEDFLLAALDRESARDLRAVGDRAMDTGLPAADVGAPEMARSLAAIMQELGLGGRGARTAVAAHVDLLLVALARIEAETGAAGASDRQTLLFRRFRRLVEEHFRAQWAVADYARALGISRDRLHDVCRLVAARPAMEIVHDRLVVEAKRALVYSTAGVAEIAFDLGFRDPAYFSRFFARRAGCAPSEFRRLPRRMPAA